MLPHDPPKVTVEVHLQGRRSRKLICEGAIQVQKQNESYAGQCSLQWHSSRFLVLHTDTLFSAVSHHEVKCR